MEPDSTALDPRLPSELERVIFELLAQTHPETILTLILVAKRVHIWIQPLLYRVFLVERENRDKFFGLVESKPEFLRANVKYLALSAQMQRAEVTTVLSTCSNVEDLTVWIGDTYPAMLDDLRRLTNLRRLSIDLNDLFGGDENFKIPLVEEHSFARHITHLNLFGNLERLGPVLRLFPALTHLAFGLYIPALLKAALDTCPTLQVLVVVWTNSEDYSEEDAYEEITDERYCTVNCYEFRDDWVEGVRGGIDFWRRAEAFLDAKRRREIPETEFHCDS